MWNYSAIKQSTVREINLGYSNIALSIHSEGDHESSQNKEMHLKNFGVLDIPGSDITFISEGKKKNRLFGHLDRLIRSSLTSELNLKHYFLKLY